MSIQYPDLNLVLFPDGEDTFTQMIDITASDGPLIQQYMDAINKGNQTLASQIFNQIPSGSQKIIRAAILNKISQAIQALERFYGTDVSSVIESKQNQWISDIERFSFLGEWSAGTTYEIYNMVTYMVNGINYIYLAIQSPPSGTVPTNTTYWRKITIQGQQGISGVGLNYRGQWQASVNYTANTAVSYNNVVWMATQPSLGQPPALDSSYWKAVIYLQALSYPVQPDSPATLQVGGLWFNTSNNPNQYYYLSSLSNPASASQITSGYQAYDQNGQLITGTA